MSLVHRLFSTAVRNMGTRTHRMEELLQKELSTSFIDIINESHMHNVPKEAETHFKVVIVSPVFTGLSRVKREQKVQGLLSEEMKTGLHALSIIAKTPEEWETMTKEIEPSPNCRGGYGK